MERRTGMTNRPCHRPKTTVSRNTCRKKIICKKTQAKHCLVLLIFFNQDLSIGVDIKSLFSDFFRRCLYALYFLLLDLALGPYTYLPWARKV
jgi:hypothetical protein